MGDRPIFILGGYGETGRRLARYLMMRTDLRLILGGRNEERAQEAALALNVEFPGERATGLRFDAGSQEDVKALPPGIRLFVHAGPALAPGTVQRLAEWVIEAGADWMDVQLDPRQTAALEPLATRIEDAGCCFAVQGGFHPGVPAVLVRWAAGHVERLESAVVASFLNYEGGLPYTSGVDELIAMFDDYHAHVFRDGNWLEVRGSSMSTYPKIDFAFGYGRHRTTPMDLDEMWELPAMIPSLRHTGFYIGGFNGFANWVAGPIIMAGLKLFPRVSHSTWGRFFCWACRAFARPPYGTLVQIDAAGECGNAPACAHLAMLHPDGYDLTAIPVVATLEQMLDGSARPPGIYRMAHLPEPERFLRDLEAMGVKVERKVDTCE